MRISETRRADVLDHFLPAGLRAEIEERYWRPIERATVAARLIGDTTFLAAPDRHPVLFSDHGVVHVRDVALGAVTLAGMLDGVLLPARSSDRLDVVRQIAVLHVYLHDTGMVEPTAERRKVHPQWAAQLAFTDEFRSVGREIAALEPLAGVVHQVVGELDDGVPAEVRVAEVLALTLCHSKSLVPASVLDDMPLLRALVTHAVMADLDDQIARGEQADLPSHVRARGHLPDLAFAWLTSPTPACRRLAVDAVDAVRVVRAADALRQRGTVQRTSAGYEVFLDTGSGRALFAIRMHDRAPTRYLGIDSPISAGEAAIRQTTVTDDGHLRIWMHAERFTDEAVAARAADHVAVVVADVADDVLPSFASTSVEAGLGERSVAGDAVWIELVGHHASGSFARRVAEALHARRPDLGERLRLAGELLPDPPADDDELARVEAAPRLAPDHADDYLAPLREVAGIRRDLDAHDVSDVRVVSLDAGEVLVRPGMAAAFAYVPMGPGLRVEPLGGYAAVPAPAWEVVGITGVMRAGERNALVRADAPLTVLAIDADTFRRRWFRPLDARALVDALVQDGHDRTMEATT